MNDTIEELKCVRPYSVLHLFLFLVLQFKKGKELSKIQMVVIQIRETFSPPRSLLHSDMVMTDTGPNWLLDFLGLS